MNERWRSFIYGIICQTFGNEPDKITDDMALTDIAPDSIALFELLLNFEKALGRHVTYEEIASIETVGDIVAFAATLPPETLEHAYCTYPASAS